VDANLLLRFLTGEPAEMAERAKVLLERAEKGEVVLLVEPVTVAETVWVLQSFYGYSHREVADGVLPLLERPALRVREPRRGVISRSLERMSEGGVDFVDALLAETALAHGDGVASFDRGFRRMDVERLEP
jgi:predicted nucleic acid-binding protein